MGEAEPRVVGASDASVVFAFALAERSYLKAVSTQVARIQIAFDVGLPVMLAGCHGFTLMVSSPADCEQCSFNFRLCS